MKKQKQISVYIDNEERVLIKEASVLVGLNPTTFCRTSAIKEARLILKNNTKKERENGRAT